MTPEPDYCPHINICQEARREICYSKNGEYKACTFYETNNTIAKIRQERVKGLAKKLREK